MSDDTVREIWSDDDLDLALRTLRSDVDTDTAVLARSRTELITAAGGTPAEPAAPGRNRSRRWPWLAAACATAVALVASLLLVRLDQPEPNAVAADLNVVADLVVDRVAVSDEPVPAGRYRYIATHAWWMSTAVLPHDSFSYLEERVIETWVPADERQEWLRRDTVTGERKWIDGTEEEAKAAGVSFDRPPKAPELRAPCGDFHAENDGRAPCTQEGGWQEPDAEFMAELPRDQEELYHRLRDDTDGRGPDPDLEMLVYVADLLRSGLVPADLRAALYRTLGLVPGLEVTEKVANLDGHEGVAYGISAAGVRHDIIIDPATGRFLGEREITEEGYQGVPAGTVVSYTSVTTAVVEDLGDVPAG
ncbi:CU044_5270 family protein [Actinophytocola gossypii]|uniref:CU044_5270 family protein n=1 Tax=Actinophytocola gossypii TaxID=2812003 RepID=A0ABT2J400_9PSEU|nr:CU044_5270 family protein [Actinophytocola gossypii]MCT2582592.1 CU044_5270 family protein [Actinophytocola gossypii]